MLFYNNNMPFDENYIPTKLLQSGNDQYLISVVNNSQYKFRKLWL